MARKPYTYPHPTAGAERIPLDAPLIAGFVETFLQPHFDRAKSTPAFHYELWEWDCSAHELGIASAPRGHAKTTGVTVACTLADVLFGAEDFEIIIGANETKASDFLENIEFILTDPMFSDLHDAFDIQVLKCNETELVGRVKGREFCVMARGAGGKVRGELWRQKRPGKIRIDDLENDEDIENADTRKKNKRWVENAVIPALADNGKLRMLGTILHEDSLISNYLADSQLNLDALTAEGKVPQWYGKHFSAHRSFDDFRDILWPEKFNEARLRAIRQRYINAGNKNGYSQEYLGVPIADGNEFFKVEGFLEMEPKHFTRQLNKYGSVDFAVSDKRDTDGTAFGIVGMDQDNTLCVLNVVSKVMNTLDAVNMWFDLDTQYSPEFWIVENENIAKAVGPFLFEEMTRRNHYLNLVFITPKQDKKMRARSFQARHAARSVRYNKQMPGNYDELEHEMMTFPRGKHDDRVDALSLIGLHLHEFASGPTPEEQDEEEYAEMVSQTGDSGRSSVTGY